MLKHALKIEKDLAGRYVLADELDNKEAIEDKEAEVAEGWKGTAKAMKKHKEIDNPFALSNWMAKQEKGDPWGFGKLKKEPKSHYTEKGKKKSSIDDEKIIKDILDQSNKVKE